MAAGIGATAAEVETRFVAIGEGLQEMAAVTEQLVERGNRIGGGATDEKSANVEASAASLVHGALGAIEECAGRTRELLAQLELYHTMTGQLLKEEQQVERILAPLRIIQRLFRIESVVLPPSMKAGFDALSGEIPRFEAEVRDSFSKHAEALEQTRTRIAMTIVRLRERLAEQARTTTAERKRIDDALKVVQQDAARGAERNDRLAEIIREIGAATRGLVVSLQYQDITRQKMDHIIAAVRELAERQDIARGDPGRLQKICRVEAVQAHAVERELDQALGTIAKGLGEISHRFAQMDTECWPRHEFETVAAAAGERFDALRTIIRETHDLIPLALQNADEVVRVINEFAGVTENVAINARTMAENMRLIALNAQVLAGQAGEKGAGLLVLAERTYLISGEIKAVTDSISREFSESSGQLTAVNEQCRALERHACTCRDHLDKQVQPIEQRLSREHDIIMADLREIGVLLERLHERLATMENAATPEPGFGRGLLRAHDHLQAISSACGPRAGETAVELGEIERRYTMASERAVHASVVHKTAALRPNAAAAGRGFERCPAHAPAPTGENVELF